MLIVAGVGLIPMAFGCCWTYTDGVRMLLDLYRWRTDVVGLIQMAYGCCWTYTDGVRMLLDLYNWRTDVVGPLQMADGCCWTYTDGGGCCSETLTSLKLITCIKVSLYR